jgi:hypothetical protein
VCDQRPDPSPSLGLGRGRAGDQLPVDGVGDPAIEAADRIQWPLAVRPGAAAVRIEDYADTLRGHRVLHLVGKGNKPATMPVTVPVLRVLEACRGQRTSGPLIRRPVSGQPVDRRDVYRMVTRIAKAAGIPRHISPHSLRHAAITNALDAGVPLRDAQILARHADPRSRRALRPRPRQPRPPRRALPHRLRRRRLTGAPELPKQRSGSTEPATIRREGRPGDLALSRLRARPRGRSFTCPE